MHLLRNFCGPDTFSSNNTVRSAAIPTDDTIIWITKYLPKDILGVQIEKQKLEYTSLSLVFFGISLDPLSTLCFHHRLANYTSISCFKIFACPANLAMVGFVEGFTAVNKASLPVHIHVIVSLHKYCVGGTVFLWFPNRLWIQRSCLPARSSHMLSIVPCIILKS